MPAIYRFGVGDSPRQRQLAAAVDAVSTVAAPVTVPGADLLWAADWGYGAGSTDTHLTDNNKFDVLASGTVITIVVTDTELGSMPAHWPTNMMRVGIAGEDDDMVGFDGTAPWSVPANGEYLWYRMLAYHAGNAWAGGELHNFESNVGSIAWTFLENSSSGATFDGGFKTYLGGSGNGTITSGGHAGFRASIPTETPLRYVLGIEKLSSTTVRFHPYIYNDSTSALLADADDLVWQDTGGTFAGSTLGEFQSGGGLFTHSSETEMFRSVRIGQQGPVGGGTVTAILYYAGFAVASSNPGTYVAGEADGF